MQPAGGRVSSLLTLLRQAHLQPTLSEPALLCGASAIEKLGLLSSSHILRAGFPTASGGKGEGGHLPHTHTTSQQMRSRASCPTYAALCCPGELKLPSAVASEGQEQLSRSYDPGASSPNYRKWQGMKGKEYYPHAHTTSLQMTGRASSPRFLTPEPALLCCPDAVQGL